MPLPNSEDAGLNWLPLRSICCQISGVFETPYILLLLTSPVPLNANCVTEMFITEWAHFALDYCLSCVQLVQNREIGWKTLDRKTGHFERERQPIVKKLKLLVLLSPLMQWIDRTNALKLWIHDKTIKAGQ